MIKPNVLFIICHDLGRHLGCYGNKSLSTPNLDALAQQGVMFNNYFATAPLCSPSRGSIMTGRYPHSNGLMGLAHIGWDLASSEITMAQRFKQAGYTTHLFGLQHESPDPFRLGYDTIVSYRHTLCNEVAPLVNEFLRHYAYHRNTAEPFFAVTGFFETHRPYTAELYEYDDPELVEVPPYLPDHPLVRQDIAQLNGSIRKMDKYVGIILETLDELRLADDTIVIFTTDHGIAFPRAKSTLYDPGIGTALIMRWPNGFEGERICSELLSNIDLLPTLLELIDIPVDDSIQGYSFAPLLKQEEYTQRGEVFAEKTWHDSYDPIRAVRTQRYKYIRNFIPAPALILPGDIAESLSMKALGANPLGTPRPDEELYDLDIDPHEQNNLIGCPKYAEVERQLRQKLEIWMEETRDSLLNGPISMPRYTDDSSGRR